MLKTLKNENENKKHTEIKKFDDVNCVFGGEISIEEAGIFVIGGDTKIVQPTKTVMVLFVTTAN